jgi:hypothetical protein
MHRTGSGPCSLCVLRLCVLIIVKTRFNEIVGQTKRGSYKYSKWGLIHIWGFNTYKNMGVYYTNTYGGLIHIHIWGFNTHTHTHMGD